MTAGHTKNRQNNFDALRIFAACCVFFSHTFPLYGLPEVDFITHESLHPVRGGLIGVTIFFVISGYLITQSWQLCPRPRSFAIKRVLRIYPALIVNMLVVSCLIIPMTTTLSLPDYFSQLREQGLNLLAATLTIQSPNLPGAFAHNPITLVNGPLWTLPYELLCYATIMLFGIIMGLRVAIPMLLLGYVALFWQDIFYPSPGGQPYMWCAAFLLGSCFYLYEKYIPLHPAVALGCLAALVLLCLGNFYWLPAYLLCITYLTLYVALKLPYLGNAARYGDLSYGMYIYAWPIQQSVAAVFAFEAGMFYAYVAVSFLLTLFCAACSWHAIEKNALRLKRKWT